MAIIPDMTDVEASGGGPGQAPPGWRLMMVKEVERKPKNANGNEVEVVTFECLEPAHVGKVAKENFTITHPVGLSRYKGLCEALGFTVFKGLDNQLLKGRPVMILVAEEEFTTNKGEKAKFSKATSWKSGAEEFKKLCEAQSGGATGGGGGTPATATAGAAKDSLGF